MSAVIKEELLNFRPLVEKDVPELLAIEESAYAFPWNRNIFQDCLRVGYCSWALERYQSIIAYGILSIGAGECHILNLCVHPESQGIGLGQIMLDFLMDIARKHKADMVFLEVRPSNVIAQKLYSRAGFDEVGMRRNYYPANSGREDALIMARSLI